jgi:hypothetical protein
MFSKLAVSVLGIIGLSLLAGLKTSSEYLTVLSQQGTEAVADLVPMNIEIDRLETIIQNLDEDLAGARRVRAEAALSLEKAQTQLVAKQEELRTQRKQVEACKARLADHGNSDGGCQSTAKGKDLACLAKACLDRFKTTQRTVEALETTVSKLKTTQDEIVQKLETRRQERDLLVGRLDAIRSEKESLGWLAGGSGNLPSSDNLKRANELAEKLEDKLKVERAIVTTEDTVWRDLASHDDSPSVSSESLLKELDQALEEGKGSDGAE